MPVWHGEDMDHWVDVGPAAAGMKGVLLALPPDTLQHDTPCSEFTVGDLLNHCSGAIRTLAEAAERAGSAAPSDSRGHGGDEAVTATGLCVEVDRLARAWSNPALAGVESTTAGEMTMPVGFHNMIVVQELVLHAWDLATATSLDYTSDPITLEALHEFLTTEAADSPRDGSGPFGPTVPVDDGATTLDRVLGMSGRDPDWQPSH